jgi:hypothetical protein
LVRVISRLSAASPRSSNPWGAKRPRRAKGSRARGLAYEKLVAQAIPGALHGQWFDFLDAAGPGCCCPDVLLLAKRATVCIEVKLTDCDEGREQLSLLYAPILRWIYQKPVLLVLVVKHLTPRSTLVVEDLRSALRLAESGAIPTLHWLGRGPILGRKPPLGHKIPPQSPFPLASAPRLA